MSTWDDKPNDYEHALAEIERLRAALDTIEDYDVAGAVNDQHAINAMRRIAREALNNEQGAKKTP